MVSYRKPEVFKKCIHEVKRGILGLLEQGTSCKVEVSIEIDLCIGVSNVETDL